MPESLPVPSAEPVMSYQSPRPWVRTISAVVIAIGLLGGGFWLGNHFQIDLSQPLHPTLINSTASATDNPLIGEVETLLKSKYLRANQLNEQQLMYGAITGMVAAAGDPYTAFFDPTQNKNIESQLSGTYQGIGAELGYDENKQLVVIAPLKGSPAEADGVKAGDLILKIDDTSTTNMTVDTAVTLIRGKADTTVKLTILHPGDSDSVVIPIIRKDINVNTITLTYKDDPNQPAGNQQIAYLTLSRFGETTEDEWDKAVADISSHQAKALILDLRNDPGGYLEAAIHVGSDFFTDGTIVGQQDAKGHVQNFSVDHPARLANLPVVVLINGGSASASEIVSGALKSRQRATLIGENSFGKGSVQEVVDLPNNTSLHVTIAKWLMPNGANIDKVGIKPDQEVKLTQDDLNAGKDPQLDAAITAAAGKIK